jgi:hypothetical protein
VLKKTIVSFQNLENNSGAKQDSLGSLLGASPKPRDFQGMSPVDQVRLILEARSTTIGTAE